MSILLGFLLLILLRLSVFTYLDLYFPPMHHLRLRMGPQLTTLLLLHPSSLLLAFRRIQPLLRHCVGPDSCLVIKPLQPNFGRGPFRKS